jgi:hypothetical protein
METDFCCIFKCDGEKPSCQRCAKAGLMCTGYERSLDFAFFNGHSTIFYSSNKKSTVIPSHTYQTAFGVENAPIHAGHDDGNAKSTQVVVMNSSMDKAMTTSQYKIGFTAVLQDRYVPDLPRLTNQTEGICSAWITTACDLSLLKGSGMLSDSLLAMSLALVAGERNDPDIAASGLRYYSRALHKLRFELQPGPRALGEHQMDISLVTCLACATYEVR